MAFVSALLEAVGVGSVMPFVAVATNPDVIDRTNILRNLQNFAGLERTEFVVLLGVLFVVITVIANLAIAANTFVLAKFSARVTCTLSTRLLRKILVRPYSYFLGTGSAELIALVLTSTRRVSDGIVFPFITMLSKGISATFILGVLLWTDPSVAFWVVVLIAPIYGLTYFFVRGKLNHLGAEIAAQDRASYRFANEALSGVKDLMILGRTDYVTDRFEASVRSLAEAQTTGALLGQLPKYAIETVGVFMIVGVILWALINSREPSVAVSLAALYAYAGYRLLPAAQALFGNLSIIKYNTSSIGAVTHVLEDPESIAPPHDSVAAGTDSKVMIMSRVDLKDITFTYKEGVLPALDAVSIEIPRGSHVAIVGASGSGKSTLLDVLVGLLSPERGGIFVDDRPLQQSAMADWRSTIGYVPQAVFLSDASISENIAFGIPPDKIDERRVRAAASAAQINEFVEKSLASGYQTPVGERGVRLSGGQRQRLGIARALYHDPELLILDEATNALDTATEGAFMNTIRTLTGSRTIVSVAHRISTVRACERIYVIAAGRVVASGNYSELERSSEDFRNLIKIQSREDERKT